MPVKLYFKNGQWYCTDGTVTSQGKESPVIAYGNYKIGLMHRERAEAHRRILDREPKRTEWCRRNSYRYQSFQAAWNAYAEHYMLKEDD